MAPSTALLLARPSLAEDAGGGSRRLDRWTTILGGLVVIASVLNGAGFFLRRIGILDTAAYRQDLARFCREPLQALWLPASCHFRRVLSSDPLRVLTIDSGRLYAAPGPEILLKLAKYGLLGGIVVVSLLLVLRGRNPLPGPRALRPALPLLICLGIAGLVTLHRGGSALALISLLSLAWLGPLLLGGWLSRPPRLERLAGAVALLLLLQLPLGLVEAMRGLPTSFGPLQSTLLPPDPALPSRLAHAFILPNTLGVVAVCGLGFCLSYGGARRWLPWLGLAVLPPILLARSAAGLLTLMILLGWPLLRSLQQRMPPHRRRLGWLLAGGLAGALLLALPRMLGRPDVFQSLLGRMASLGDRLDPRHPLTLLLGQGLGAAGNRISELLTGHHGLQPLLSRWVGAHPPLQSSDSMLVLLLVQGGLLAVLAFYGLLLWAFRRDPLSRPFLLAVLLCSLTLNVTEIFPLDLLLGLALNRCLLLPPCRPV